MKQLFIILFLGSCLVTSSNAQFTYLGGPEGYNITYMAALGDSLLAVNGNQVYLNAPTSPKKWTAFSQGLFGKDSLIRAFASFRGQVFVAQSNKVFSLKTGSNQWQENFTGIPLNRPSGLFINLNDQAFFVRTFEASTQLNYWYQYDSKSSTWISVDRQFIAGGSARLALLPNGNILSFQTVPNSLSQYRARFDASTGQWQRLDTVKLALFNSVIALSNTELLAGATSSGRIYRSIDGGKNWTQLSPSPVPSAGGVVSLYKANQAIYAVATQYIARSLDGGNTWKEVNDFAYISSSSPFIAYDSSSYVIAQGIPFFHINSDDLDGAFSLEIDPPFYCTNILQARENLFFFGRGGLFTFEEQDGEAAVVSYTYDLPKAPLSTTVLQKAGSGLIAYADFALHRFTPGQGWSLAMDSLDLYIPYINLRGIETLQDTVVIFDGLSSYYSFNQGKSWKEVNYTPYAFSFQGFANANGKQLFTSFDGDLYLWVGKNQEWVEITRPGNNLAIRELQSKGDTLVVNTNSGWFYTITNGKEWTATNLPDYFSNNFYSSNGKLYNAEFRGLKPVTPLYETNVAGQDRLLFSPPTNVGIFALSSLDSFIIVTLNPNQGYIVYSSNRGNTWKNLNTRQIGFVINVLIDSKIVYLATSTGVWTMPLSNLTTGIFELRPLVQAQLQAWPNPSSGLFTIKDSNQNLKSALQVKVFNTLGQLVKEQKVQVWNNQFELDLQGQTPGQYWLWASDGEKIWSTKLLKQ
jgi:photosystem II stability/assembly factor-like uncharacterized protein